MKAHIVLDTSVLSQFFHKDGAPKPLTDWFNSVLDENLLISPIARLEIEFGLARIKNVGPRLVDRFRQFVADTGINEEPITGKIASMAAAKKQEMEAQGRQFHNEDLLIGALAAWYAELDRSAHIATYNNKDFEQWGIPLINP
jgi:predicted nucleic acid-binding protein